MPSSFTLVTETSHSAQALFDLSLSIDAHVDSMRSSGERAVAGVTAGQIGLGETVTWRARHFGVWFTMTSQIVELEAPYRFVDEQLEGPFALFRHEHVFESAGALTKMTDTVTLASPVLGRLVEPLVLLPHLRRLIVSRNRRLVELLDAASDGGRGD